MPAWGKTEFDQFYSSQAERWGRPGSRPPILLHYHWFNIIQYQEQSGDPNDRVNRLATILGMGPGAGVVLVGCGFNGTGKGLTDLGMRVLGTDLSTYIQQQKGQTEEAELRAAIQAAGLNPDTDLVIGPPGNVMVNPLDLFMEGGRAAPKTRGRGEILEEELRTRGSRNAVLNRVTQLWPGQSINFVISEEVLNSITDAEADLVCSYMHSAGGSSEWNATIAHMLSPLQTGVTQAPSLNWKTYAGWRTWLNTEGYSNHLIVPTVTARGQGMAFPSTQGAMETYLINVRGITPTEAPAMATQAIADQTVFAYSGVF